jgi:endonuclease G
MKIKHLQITGMLMLVMFGTACRKDKTSIAPNENRSAVKFSSTINGQIQTNAVDNSWAANDNIGVFMKTGTGLSTVLFANKTYNTPGDGTFAPAATDQTMYYPEDGGSVDFIAYYPYKQTLTANKYTVDVSSQSNLTAIDLLYSNNAVGLNKNNSNANLVFTHQLAKVEFTVRNGNGVADLNGLGVNISALKTGAEFDLATGSLTAQDPTASITLKTSIKNGATLAEAILIPTTNETGTQVVFSLGTKTFTWKLPTNTKFEKGKKYTYDIELTTNGNGNNGTAISANSTITNWTDVPSGSYSLDQETVTTTPISSSYMETPAIATDENTVYVSHGFPGKVNVRNYAMLYDKKYKVAYWVAYPMHASYIGSSGRTDAWGYDPAIAQADQVNLSSSFGNGYDRGHQIPSGDRTATRDLNATTFYYSNMTAQVSSMNQGIWNNLEQQVRTWTAQSDTLYVVTGAAIRSKTDQTITYSKGSAIPKYYYKALAMKKGDTYYTIAFKINNEVIPSGTSYNSFRMNVSDLEKETGYTFFPKLPNESKTSIDSNIWK